MARYFNTSGPNIPEKHYTLKRGELISEGKKLVDDQRYFTIWAPRQTGKSTYFRLLAEELQKDGYKVLHINVENFLSDTEQSFLKILSSDFEEGFGLSMLMRRFSDLFEILKKNRSFKGVLIVDEVEGLNPEIFGQFLHTIRNLYHSRQTHCLKSVILVGVTNIIGVVEDNASPFNIADNLAVPYFTDEETFELLHQHEAETGQLFEEKVKTKICDMTANQPGLVNGFAQQLILRQEEKPVIEFEDYLQVEHWYLSKTIDKNISNVLNKARKYRTFVEKLLFTEAKIPFRINREDIKVLHTNGLLTWDEEDNVTFWVPLYKKCLYDAFYPYMNGEKREISRELWVDEYFDKKNNLLLDKFIDNYNAYIKRRGFRYFREKDEDGNYLSLKEAALVYSFETYIQAFLQEAQGKSYLEPHTGLGRCDLLVNVRDKEYVFEPKVYRSPSEFHKGQRQLAHYCESLGLTTGTYLVFIPSHINLPQVITDSDSQFENVLIKTWLVFYDEEKDF